MSEAGRPTGGRLSHAADAQEELLNLLRTANRRIRELLEDSVRTFGLQATEYRALTRIGRGLAPSPTPLARQLRITPASTTDLLDRLENRGLLKRSPNPDDRRSTRLYLTEKGERLAMQAQESYVRTLARVTRAMSAQGRERLRDGLAEFAQQLDRLEPKSGPRTRLPRSARLRR